MSEEFRHRAGSGPTAPPLRLVEVAAEAAEAGGGASQDERFLYGDFVSF